jgi:hypothetical protein
MKKLLLLLSILAFLLAPLFAETCSFYLNGVMLPVVYTFSLVSGAENNDAIEVTKENSPTMYTVQRSKGNSFNPVTVEVTIITSNFKYGNIKTDDVPEIVMMSCDASVDFLPYTVTLLSNDKTTTQFTFDVPAGVNKESANVAGFYLELPQKEGDNSDKYTSNISVEFSF